MQSPGHPPVENTFAVGFRARGLRLGSGATTQQLDLVETFFDVQAAATIEQCGGRDLRSAGDNARCTGTETQFKFRGTVQEEKPLRDWMREVLINCLGFYTFSFGKIKAGVRVDSSAVEAFTEGNILFRSLKLAPLKPSFNQITAHFADEDFEFVANSVAVYNVDHALLPTGGAGP